VSYEGEVLERYVVGNVLDSPPAIDTLQSGLTDNNMQQYQPYTDVEKINTVRK